MTSRDMVIAFEELVRNTNPDLEFDINMNSDVIYSVISRAQEEYITTNFLLGDSIIDNINNIRKRSDVLRKIIKRSDATVAASATSKQVDGGYLATIDESDYRIFLSGVLTHASLPTNDKGSSIKAVELDLINHYDLQKKVRTINNEPVLKQVPIVLEGDDTFVFYLGKEYYDALDSTISACSFDIIYLAHPPAITSAQNPSLSESTHNDIVKLATEIFIKEYKYLLGTSTTKPNG